MLIYGSSHAKYEYIVTHLSEITVAVFLLILTFFSLFSPFYSDNGLSEKYFNYYCQKIGKPNAKIVDATFDYNRNKQNSITM